MRERATAKDTALFEDVVSPREDGELEVTEELTDSGGVDTEKG